jgi:hypothetical protein
MRKSIRAVVLLAIVILLTSICEAQLIHPASVRPCSQQIHGRDCRIDIDLVRPDMPGQLTLLSGVGVVVRVLNERIFETCSLTSFEPPHALPQDQIVVIIDDLVRSGAQQTQSNASIPGLTETGRNDTIQSLASDLIRSLDRLRFLTAIRIVDLGSSIRHSAPDGTKLLDRSDYRNVRNDFATLGQELLARSQKLSIDPNRPLDEAVRRGLLLLLKVVNELQKDQIFDQTLYIPAYNDTASSNHKAGEGTRFLYCTDSISGLTTLFERFEVRWRDPQRIFLSAGVLISSLAWSSFKSQQIASGQTEIISDTNVPQIEPVFLFNYKVWSKVWWARSINFHLSPGVVLNIHDGTLRPEFMVGATVNVGSTVLTVGPHIGHRLSLAGGLPLNIPLNIAPGITPSTTDNWKVGAAVAVTYRLPIH